MINPGTKLPAFKTVACVSTKVGEEFAPLSSDQFAGKWLVFYTYPKDFTFVCPTEIAEFDKQLPEFEKRGAVLVGGSTDNEHSHLAWRQAEEMLRELHHPLVFVSPQMAKDLDLIHPSDGVALRVTVIVDPEGVIRFACANDLDTGRNVDEVLRVLDSLQTGGLTACNWKRGQGNL